MKGLQDYRFKLVWASSFMGVKAFEQFFYAIGGPYLYRKSSRCSQRASRVASCARYQLPRLIDLAFAPKSQKKALVLLQF